VEPPTFTSYIPASPMQPFIMEAILSLVLIRTTIVDLIAVAMQTSRQSSRVNSRPRAEDKHRCLLCAALRNHTTATAID
jgi:hypothetical protein